jgi:subtilase family serine protease
MFAHATLVECSHPALAPNVEAVVRIDVINPHEAGSYPILTTVDPDNTVAESNEGNNSYTDKHVIP